MHNKLDHWQCVNGTRTWVMTTRVFDAENQLIIGRDANGKYIAEPIPNKRMTMLSKHLAPSHHTTTTTTTTSHPRQEPMEETVARDMKRIERKAREEEPAVCANETNPSNSFIPKT